MRALVTGCAGFIGSHLSDSLLADGHQVVGVDAFTDNYPATRKLRNLAVSLAHDGFELHRADLGTADLEPLLDGCDAVFHLAAEPGVQPSFGPRRGVYWRTNVMATERLVAAAEPGVRHVLASSSSVYGDPLVLPTPEWAPLRPASPYAQTKLAAERAWRRLGADGVTLRLFTVYGPRQRPDMAIARFRAAAREGREVVLHGSPVRDFTYVADVVEALRLAAEEPAAGGHVLNVGAGAPVAVEEVLGVLSQLGPPLRVRRGPPRRGDAVVTSADVSQAWRVLGWEPRTCLADGLEALTGQPAPERIA